MTQDNERMSKRFVDKSFVPDEKSKRIDGLIVRRSIRPRKPSFQKPVVSDHENTFVLTGKEPVA